METTKSPSTGYTVTDYVQKVFEHLHMLIACAMVLERSGFDSNMLKEALKELKRRESDG